MWWGWPWMNSPLFYWSESGKVIYLIGNPIIWWLTSILFLSFLVLPVLMYFSDLSIVKKVQKEEERAVVSPTKIQFQLVLIAYFVSFLPLIVVSRPLFLYHYFTPLIFSIIYVSLWLDYIGWLKPHSLFRQRMSVYFVLFAVVVSFYLIIPLTYGLVNSSKTAELIFLVFPGWQ